jgi:hypothetical protein
MHRSSKLKSRKEVTKQYNRYQGFSKFFCMLMEGLSRICIQEAKKHNYGYETLVETNLCGSLR